MNLDASAFLNQQQNNGLYGDSMYNPNNFDFNAQQRLQNGSLNSASPAAFQGYNVNRVVPSKRPRPSDDISASPHQHPGSINISRSQTPQQGPYAGFQGNQHGGQQFQAPTPYQHLQQGGSSNATPSPTMPNQPFRQPSVPQRMPTGSPSPFHPAQGQQGMGMSPTPDQNSRVNTPQNAGFPQMGGAPNFMPGTSMPQGFNPNFGGMNTMGMAGGLPQQQQQALAHNLQQHQLDMQKRYQYQMQLQQQRSMAMMQQQQQRQQAGLAGGSNSAAGQHANMGTPTRAPGQSMGMGGGRNNQEQFLRSVAAVMQQQGRPPVDQNPTVCGRPVNLMNLYAFVLKGKGSKNVTVAGLWPAIANQMGLPPMEFPQAGQELKAVYEKNLYPFEQAWVQQQRAKQNQMRMNIDPNQQGQMHGAGMPSQMSPTRPTPQTAQQNQSQQQQYIQQLQRASSLQADHGTPVQNNSGLNAANGWATPQNDSAAMKQQEPLNNQHRKSVTRQLDANNTPGPPANGVSSSPATSVKKEPAPAGDVKNDSSQHMKGSQKLDHGTNYEPRKRQLDSWGGVPRIEENSKLGTEIAARRPDVPMVPEMGIIDLRAISLSLQSGIHAEVRYALDVLVRLSCDEHVQLELDKCDDLLYVLIDCAEDQVEALADAAEEVTDVIDITQYEDVVRSSRAEQEALQDYSDFGSHDWDLDRAADRLLGATVILRNLSFFECNTRLLGSSPVVKLLSNAFRLLGTRGQLLRTNANTAELMKDAVLILSNLASEVKFSSRDDALNILQFLLAFAPTPAPVTSSLPLRFPSYNPSIHKYLPYAVDALAKLLTTDDPNRNYFKYIFNAEAASVAQDDPEHSASIEHYTLLTRAFGLAISTIPDRTRPPLITMSGVEVRIAEARKTHLMQGMLAADILSTLCPGPDSGVAAEWLNADDGWAGSLVRLVSMLSTPRALKVPPGAQPRTIDHEGLGFGIFTNRALGMLKRLGTMSGLSIGGLGTKLRKLRRASVDGVDGEDGQFSESEDEETGNASGLLDVLPKSETLLGAILTPDIDPVALRGLCSLASLEA